MYKYLLWDIDGTILDFHAAEDYAIKTLLKKYRLGMPSKDELKLYAEINRKYWQKLERGEMTKPEILVGRFREFFETTGRNPSCAESFNDDYQLSIGDCIVFFEDAKETLLEEKGKYILAAVTNGTKVAQDKKLSLSGLDKIFDSIFISEDVGFEKPNKEYFDFVFKSLGITDKSEVLIIGDSLTSDIKGGYLSGIDTCWFNPEHSENTLNIPLTYEIDSIRQIDKILKDKEKNK